MRARRHNFLLSLQSFLLVELRPYSFLRIGPWHPENPPSAFTIEAMATANDVELEDRTAQDSLAKGQVRKLALL